MDKERTSVLLELNNMQTKISTLFQDLIKEKNVYKENTENLIKQLEKLSNEVCHLRNEAKNLKQQKEVLKKSNEEMMVMIDRGIKIFKNVNLKNENFLSEHKFALDSLKKILLELSRHLKHSAESADGINPDGLAETVCTEDKRNNFREKEAERELKLFDDLNFSTNFYHNEDDWKSPKKGSITGKNSSGTVLKTLFQNTYEVIKTLKSSSGSENESCESELVNTIVYANTFQPVPPSPEEEIHLSRSPVFKDIGVRKHESLSNEENNHISSTSGKPFNEKFLDLSSSFKLSPWKKSPQSNKETSPSTPKRVKKKLHINSPDRSPLSFLKKSNAREAEVSSFGIKRLRQTFLNLDYYKKKNSEENPRNTEKDSCKKEDKKPSADLEDDDFIIESPKNEQVLEENKKNEVPFTTPSENLEPDLDETYVSSSIIQKSNMPKKRELEGVIQETPIKRPAREKSPEYDSVPFVYRREPVRKKAERMKLPGHACAECNKYYENVFEDIDTEDLKKILNKCSRHRDKNPPALEDTPPGYWKPYLTCTILSHSKDDASNDGIN